MSRKKSRSIPDKDKPFIYLPIRMIRSPAFLKLSNSARMAYVLIKSQMSHYDQREITCPYSRAERYMDRHTFARSIKELIDSGFIQVRRHGGLYRFTNIFTLSDDWSRSQ